MGRFWVDGRLGCGVDAQRSARRKVFWVTPMGCGVGYLPSLYPPKTGLDPGLCKGGNVGTLGWRQSQEGDVGARVEASSFRS